MRRDRPQTRPGASVHPDGTSFRVWAPAARTVEVVLGDADAHPLEPVGRGVHTGDLDGVGAGTRYRYRLDGELLRPDPASLRQPEGVHGPSEVVDLDFRWRDAGWTGRPLEEHVIYELHVGTFTPEGTFDAAATRIPHLLDLGVTAIELMPVAEFPGARNWGYDGVDLYAVSEAYGGLRGLQRLVDACHRAGLSVLLDVVYNHLGPEGNYLHAFGPYFTDRYHTPWGEAVNLDGPGSDEVRTFLVENARMWVRDVHVDGLRLDAVHAFMDQSARPFLGELADSMGELGSVLGRHVHLIVENGRNDPRVVRRRDHGGLGLDAAWNDDFHHALHVALTGETNGYYLDFAQDPVGDVAAALADGYVNAGRFSPYRGRSHGAPSDDLRRSALVVFDQNHDQVGNRALGERLPELVPLDRVRVAAFATLLAPWVPLLFMGEEWAERRPFLFFVDHGDPELVEAVRRGRAEEFAGFFTGDDRTVPDPADADTFAASILDWDRRRDGEGAAILAFHRALISTRSSTPVVRDARPEAHRVVREGTLVTVISDDGASSAVRSLSLGDEPVRADLPDGRWRRVLDTRETRFGGDGAPADVPGRIELGPWSAAMWVREAT